MQQHGRRAALVAGGPGRRRRMLGRQLQLRQGLLRQPHHPRPHARHARQRHRHAMGAQPVLHGLAELQAHAACCWGRPQWGPPMQPGADTVGRAAGHAALTLTNPKLAPNQFLLRAVAPQWPAAMLLHSGGTTPLLHAKKHASRLRPGAAAAPPARLPPCAVAAASRGDVVRGAAEVAGLVRTSSEAATATAPLLLHTEDTPAGALLQQEHAAAAQAGGSRQAAQEGDAAWRGQQQLQAFIQPALASDMARKRKGCAGRAGAGAGAAAARLHEARAAAACASAPSIALPHAAPRRLCAVHDLRPGALVRGIVAGPAKGGLLVQLTAQPYNFGLIPLSQVGAGECSARSRAGPALCISAHCLRVAAASHTAAPRNRSLARLLPTRTSAACSRKAMRCGQVHGRHDTPGLHRTQRPNRSCPPRRRSWCTCGL